MKIGCDPLNKRFRLAIFDMDGVLVDSEKAFKHACQDALLKWGVKAEREEFVPYTGMGDILYIGGVSEAHGVPYSLEMTDVSYKLYVEYAKDELCVLPWSRRILEALKDSGYDIAVASKACSRYFFEGCRDVRYRSFRLSCF